MRMHKMSAISKITLLSLFWIRASFGEFAPDTVSKKIDLNAASIEAIDAVPGIGAKSAQRIIEMRPIRSLEELQTLPGFGVVKVNALREYVTLGDETHDDNTFKISLAGTQIPVTRLGTGQIGVIFLAHTGAAEMNKSILQDQKWLAGLFDKCTFFLWEYPQSAPPFNRINSTLEAYRGGDLSAKLPLSGIAESVIGQISEKSGLKKFLVVGNSFGAGLVLQDYATLVRDKTLSFLLISPTEAFMPSVEQIPPLERTTIIGAKGWKNDDLQMRTDIWLRGEKSWNWVSAHRDDELGDLITASRTSDTAATRTNAHGVKFQTSLPTDFSIGHKIIGGEINTELLAKLISVTLGLADKKILAERPRQTTTAPSKSD